MSHGDHHHHHHRHDASRNLGFAFFLNLTFTILEVGGGIWTNSVAILSDALHDGGDCLSLGLAWYLHRFAQKGPDAKFTLGYRRFSNMGALVTGLVLTAGLIFIGWSAVARLADPEAVYAPGMFAFAVLGVAMNGAAAWRLRGGKSLNERMVTWHLLEDTLGWVAVLVGSAVMMVWNLPIIDPLLALLISAFILWNVVRNLKQVVHVFLQGAPHGFDVEAMDRALAAIPGVVDSHHTHTWTLDGESHVFSTHLVMDAGASRDQIADAKRRVYALLEGQDFVHITIDVELVGETCSAEPTS